MKTGSKGRLPGYIALALITLIAGLALGGTYTLTEGKIREQAILAAENARKDAMPEADDFVMLEATGNAIDWIYEATVNGERIGYVAQTTVSGFGGPIEVIAGVDEDGRVTGVSVGGSSFGETPGLGANAKNKSFTERFIGKSAPIKVIKAGGAAGENTVDAITSATITSNAVAGGVNTVLAYIDSIAGQGAAEGGSGQ